MRIFPRKYRFSKEAYVDANGKPTGLQTGVTRSFGKFTVYAYNEDSAIIRASKKCKGIYKAVMLA